MEKMMKNDDNDDEKWQWRQTLLKFWWRSDDALAIIINDEAPSLLQTLSLFGRYRQTDRQTDRQF